MNLDWANSSSPVVFVLLMVWNLFWKGKALWISARKGSRNWFVALLVINSFGVLDIVYIYYLSKKNFKLPQVISGRLGKVLTNRHK